VVWAETKIRLRRSTLPIVVGWNADISEEMRSGYACMAAEPRFESPMRTTDRMLACSSVWEPNQIFVAFVNQGDRRTGKTSTTVPEQV